MDKENYSIVNKAISKVDKRESLKKIRFAGLGLITAYALPNRWYKPIVNSVMLPAHAQTSTAASFTISFSPSRECRSFNTLTAIRQYRISDSSNPTRPFLADLSAGPLDSLPGSLIRVEDTGNFNGVSKITVSLVEALTAIPGSGDIILDVERNCATGEVSENANVFNAIDFLSDSGNTFSGAVSFSGADGVLSVIITFTLS